MKALLTAAALLFSGSAFAVCDNTQVLEIDIANMAFAPAEATVCLGQTVRWTSKEDPARPRPIRHSVTFDATLALNPDNVLLPAGVEAFDSGLILPGGTFEYTFTVAGDYKYICMPHEEMGHVGSLRVVTE